VRTIPDRELLDQIDRLLREVEAGERLRITIDGRPVADLVPIVRSRLTFVPRDEVAEILAHAPLDPGFARDIAMATGATTDEL
jgi:antitoxin (DNA-binding transcriptional repressor) of toxin-antitoxin stability system